MFYLFFLKQNEWRDQRSSKKDWAWKQKWCSQFFLKSYQKVTYSSSVPGKQLMTCLLLSWVVYLGQQVCRWLMRCGNPWGGIHGLVAIVDVARGPYGLKRIN